MLVEFIYALMHSEENGYCVYNYKNLDTRKKITCVGYNLPNIQIPYEFEVEEIHHKIYGTQYKVLSYVEKVGKDEKSIVTYLGSGLFRGIGKTTAQRIYDKFKDQTMDIFENDINQLLKVKGISNATLRKIKASYEENQASKETQQFLIPYGFSIKQIVKFGKVIQDDLLNKIKENPYILCKFQGVSFKMADNLREACGIDYKNKHRLEAALYEALKWSNIAGSVGTPQNILLNNMRKISMIGDQRFLWEYIKQAIAERKISYRKKMYNGKNILYFYLNHICEAEYALAEQIIRLAKTPCKQYKNLNEVILQCCDEAGIILDESQFAAVKNSFLYNLSIITGGPGTGKTTISNIIMMVQERLKKTSDIVLLAPTGRAARRMTECMNAPAFTMHSKMQLGIHQDDDVDKTYDDAAEPINCDLLIADEFSMVDMLLALKLFQNVERGRIVLVGDKDQLASVGPGNVLKDMLESGVIPVSILEYEHRQGKDSMICVNAHNMLKGITSLEDGEDFHIHYMAQNTKDLPADYMQIIEDQMVKRYVELLHDDSIRSITCLSPYKENLAGVFSLNKRIQNAINPLYGIEEVKIQNDMTIRPNDIAMHLKNDGDVCNGDIGRVTFMTKENNRSTVYVDYSESGGPKSYEYTSDNINELTLAYAMTVHKAQGGEFDAVILCMTQNHKMLLKRNILYTSITRGKKIVESYFDTPQTVEKAILNVQSEERYTLLAFYLKEMMPKIQSTDESKYEQIKFA